MSYHVNCKSCGGVNEVPSGKISILCSFCGNAIQIEQSVSNTETEETRKERELQEKVKSLIIDGKKLHAVKLYMDEMGIGLKEAKEYIDSIEVQGKKSESSGCFIATAAMGSYDHPDVVELRGFRDNWILKKTWGKSFVKWYYKNGAIAARFIDNYYLLKFFSLILIIKPLVIISKLTKK